MVGRPRKAKMKLWVCHHHMRVIACDTNWKDGQKLTTSVRLSGGYITRPKKITSANHSLRQAHATLPSPNLHLSSRTMDGVISTKAGAEARTTRPLTNEKKVLDNMVVHEAGIPFQDEEYRKKGRAVTVHLFCSLSWYANR